MSTEKFDEGSPTPAPLTEETIKKRAASREYMRQYREKLSPDAIANSWVRNLAALPIAEREKLLEDVPPYQLGIPRSSETVERLAWLMDAILQGGVNLYPDVLYQDLVAHNLIHPPELWIKHPVSWLSGPDLLSGYSESFKSFGIYQGVDQDQYRKFIRSALLWCDKQQPDDIEVGVHDLLRAEVATLTTSAVVIPPPSPMPAHMTEREEQELLARKSVEHEKFLLGLVDQNWSPE